MKIYKSNRANFILPLLLALMSFGGIKAQYYISGSNNVSPNSTHSYTLDGGTVTNLVWSVPTGATIISSFGQSVTIRWDFVGSYQVSATYTEGIGYSSYPVSVNGPAPNTPSVPSEVSNSNKCGQVELQKGTGSPETNVFWFWQGTNSQGTNWSSSANAATNNYIATTTGTYYIRARSSSGQWSDQSASVSVTVVDFTQGEIGGAHTICSGDDPNALTNVASASGGDGGYSYQWQYSNNGLNTWDDIDGATESTYDPPAGLIASRWYRRNVTSCGGQTISTLPVKVTVNPLPSQPTLSTVNQPTCTVATGSFTITNFSGSYGYIVNPATGVSISNTGVVTAPAGTYSVTATLNGCVSAISQSRTINPQPITPAVPTLGTVTQPTCENPEGSFAITNFNGNPSSYTVSPNSGVSISNAGLVTAPPDSYTLTVTANGCTSGSSITRVVNAAPSANTYYADSDNDGLRDPGSVGEQDCNARGTGWTSNTTVDLCPNFNDPTNAPPKTWYKDTDGDGLRDAGSTGQQDCVARGVGWTLNTTVDNCIDQYDPTNQCLVPTISADPQEHNYIYTRTYQRASLTSIDSEFFTQNDTLIQGIAFVDGLGRPFQQLDIGQSPSKKDMVSHIGYDHLGRQHREWLPYPDLDVQIDPGTVRKTAKTDTNDYYELNYAQDINTSSPNPFSQKLFESSPLNRVKKQAAPGQDWAMGNGHEIEFEYETNIATDNVKQYQVGLSFVDNTYIPALEVRVDNSGEYGAGELFKNITKDENHDGSSSKLHTTEEFTDKQGRVVLKRTYANVGSPSAVEAHDTYYVYDDFGNLTFVLPPLVDTSATIDQTILDNLSYQYVYDHRNRLVEKQLPGKAREYIVYNKLDQPIMTQDALQRTTGEWLFTKYDALGRVAYTGKAVEMNGATATSRTDVQDAANGSSSQWEERGSGFSMDNMAVEYGNTAYPAGSTVTQVLTVNYYDDYNFGRANEGTPPTDVFSASVDDRTKGLATGSKIKVLDPGATPGQKTWITTITRYDDKGRPIYTYSQNDYLQTTDVVESQLDFVGKPVKVRSQHTRNGNTVVTLDNFTYDHVGRLLSQTQCIGDQTLGESCDQVNVEANPVVNTSLVTQGTVGTQSVTIANPSPSEPVVVTGGTFRVDPNAGSSGADQELIVYNDYDELGQLKSKKVGGDPNASSLGLQTVDYDYNIRGWLKSINDVTDTTPDKLFNFNIVYNGGNTPLYNGNIAQTQWRTDHVDKGLKQYNYSYDALNRITAAVNNVGTDRYGLSGISYDKNGNIQTLVRNGHVVDAPDPSNSQHFDVMDNLTYAYTGNRLTNVADNNANDSYGFVDVNGSGTEYTYDVNGNMITDTNKGITAIAYNHLNLPTSVVINGQTISYIYDAAGTKLRKNAEGSVTDYAGNYVYTDNNGTPLLEFLSHPEGYASPDGQGAYDYVYQYKDHLGNIRLSFMDNNGTLEIVEENNYYPFGLKHKGYNDAVSANGNDVAQRWKFGGKELDNSLNDALATYDFGARNYSPDLGRWMNIDPLAEKMRRHSPYNYAFNNPIFFIDPDGMMPQSTDPPEKLYHNTSASNAATIEKEGFQGSKTGRFSKYNWFSTEANAGGTGVQGADATIAVEGVDVSNAQTITNKQLKGFYNAAKKELGYTSEQIRTDPKIAKEVNSLKFKKMGEFMDAGGADAYKVGNSYAVTDEVANSASKLTKSLNKVKSGLSINLGALEAVELPLMLLEYHQIDMATTFDPNYKGLGNAEQFNYQQFGVKTPGKKLQKSSWWETFKKGLKAMNNQQ